jgi:hypothetical protein
MGDSMGSPIVIHGGPPWMIDLLVLGDAYENLYIVMITGTGVRRHIPVPAAGQARGLASFLFAIGTALNSRPRAASQPGSLVLL